MNIIKNILSLILSIIFIFTLYVLLIIININAFFSASSIEKTISDLDLTHEMKKIKNSTSANGKKTEIANLIDTVYQEAENHGISSALVDEMFNSKEIKSFLGKATGITTDYIINGKQHEKVTSKDFNKLLEQNIDKWIEQSQTNISDSKKEVLVIRIKQASAGIIDNLPNNETINKTIDEQTIKNIQFIFSNQVKIAILIIIIVSLLLLIFLKKQNKKWLIYISITGLITGLITLATSFITTDILTIILKQYNLSFIINPLSSSFSQNILLTSIITISLSLILLIIYQRVKQNKII